MCRKWAARKENLINEAVIVFDGSFNSLKFAEQRIYLLQKNVFIIEIYIVD